MDKGIVIESIYRQYFRLFLSIGRKIYGLNYDVAIDMIQDTFVKVLKKKDMIQADCEAGVRGYAICVFRHTCISHLRRPNPFVENIHNKMEQNLNESDPMKNVPDTRSNPLYEILLIEEMRLRKLIIEQLPSKYRDVVSLSLEGYKRKDIAKRLGIKETRIHNLKHRGLKQYEKAVNEVDPQRYI